MDRRIGSHLPYVAGNQEALDLEYFDPRQFRELPAVVYHNGRPIGEFYRAWCLFGLWRPVRFKPYP